MILQNVLLGVKCVIDTFIHWGGGEMADFKIIQKGSVAFGCFPAWNQLGVVHGFTCRSGGESDVVPGTLNMALHVGDDPEKVIRNRKKVAEALGFALENTVTCAQVHGTRVVPVTLAQAGRGAFALNDTIPETDGLITDCRNLPLMLFYADCVPVLLVDRKGPAIGVIHAGWRGSVGHIVQNAVQAMAEAYGTKPGNLSAAIGPSIGPCCYEVDERVHEKALAYQGCFTPHGEGHYLLDLWQLNKLQLMEAGILAENILKAGVCTCHHVDQFFSHRKEKGKTGRLAAILYRK